MGSILQGNAHGSAFQRLNGGHSLPLGLRAVYQGDHACGKMVEKWIA